MASKGTKGAKTFLGFDLSTQTLKAIIVNENLEILHEYLLSFDNELPHYKTTDGVHRSSDRRTVTSPVSMWLEAVDRIFGKMKLDGVKFSNLKALSVSGQQHGTVYWKTGANIALKHLDSKEGFEGQLKGSFAMDDSPIWMDMSTTYYCRHLETVFGGPLGLSLVTGSTAYERFSGNQIAKVCHQKLDAYDCCERISLVSSFVATLFLGYYAPIDFGDGSGMNLLNIHTKAWEERALDACAPDLLRRLGNPVSSCSIIGNVSDYMVKRYDFSTDCCVVASTGDNPSSLAGMCLGKGDVAISLGTSDTLIFCTEYANPGIEGHVFVNPVDEEHFMALLCFRNGSLAREKIRHASADGSWDAFNTFLEQTQPGNDGNIGIYFFETEIIPFAQGVSRWNSYDEKIERFSDAVEVRAVIESQFMAKRIHAETLGFCIDQNTKILATGGASSNVHILQVLANVFNAAVYVSPRTKNSACLGAAYRAKHAIQNSMVPTPFADVVRSAVELKLVATPNTRAHEVYNDLCERYKKFEKIMQMKSP